MDKISPIGIFDSGVGGLTVMKQIVSVLPDYDYLYLGDSARAPYGTRSFETIYHYTLECVKYLFSQGCHLVILACNTASAEALRNIQQCDLPHIAPKKRVLGVIRPTAEIIGHHTETRHVGVFGTAATISSKSYMMEIGDQFPELQVYQEACPMWVPLVENNEHDKPGADYFVKQHIQNLRAKSAKIDAILLACTHFPLLKPKIDAYTGDTMTVLGQGKIVADSLADYLNRHPEIAEKCTKNGSRRFLTTDSPGSFNSLARTFYGEPVNSQFIDV